MRADIAEPAGAEQRVHKRMRQNIAIGMSDGAFVKWQFDSADNQLASFRQPMKIVTNAAAHAHVSGALARVEAREIHIGGLGDFNVALGTEDDMDVVAQALDEAGFVRGLTPSACARANASLISFVRNACGVCASTTRSRGMVPVISATSSGKLARFTSFTVSMAGMPRIAAWQRRASSMTRTICSRVTKGRTASCTDDFRVVGNFLERRATESWRESPPRTTRRIAWTTFRRGCAPRVTDHVGARGDDNVRDQLARSNTAHAVNDDDGDPSSSRNCLGVRRPCAFRDLRRAE